MQAKKSSLSRKKTSTKKSSTVKRAAGTKKKSTAKSATRKTAGTNKKSTAKKAARKTRTTTSAKTSAQTKKKTQNRKASNKSRSGTGRKTEGLATEAVRIVEQAASILEEEISAGVVAAKKVEERYINVNALRSGASEQLMQRFREDAHDVLDIILDMVNLSINALGGLSERALNIRSTSVNNTKNTGKTDENLAELMLPAVLKPGETGEVGMVVENESDQPTGKFRFTSAGLLNAQGDLLNPKQIKFDPPTSNISANDLEKINIVVSIPKGTPAGQYSGLLQASALDIRAILTVQVAA